MTISTQNQNINNNVKEISDALLKFDSWTIFTHKKPDGDAAGSATALIGAGILHGKNIKWIGADKYPPENYYFLPHLDFYECCEDFKFDDPNELYIFLDCANETRSVKNFSKTANTINIDHHEDNNLYAKLNYVDGLASSTCEMLMRFFMAENWKLNKDIAESLYTGIFTDTGGFTFSNCSSLTHKIISELINLGVDPGHMGDLITQNKTPEGIALWSRALSRIKIIDEIFALSWINMQDFRETRAKNTDTEGLPNMLMSIKNIKFAVLLYENLNSEVRASFRSREGIFFGAGEIARLYGGGGHERAAGATLKGSIENILIELENLLSKKYHDGNGNNFNK